MTSDFIFVSHKARNRKTQKVKKYRAYCTECNKDRGYVFKNYIIGTCSHCSAKKSFREGKKVNHNNQGIRGYVQTPNQGIVCTRSSYETFYLEYLNRKKINYFYEPKRFILSDNSSYLPDVYIVAANEYIELKGLDRLQDKNKFNTLIKQYPNEKFIKLTIKDLKLLGYDESLYKNYGQLSIKGEHWKIQVLEPEKYEKLFGEDSQAITLVSEKQMIFRFDYLHWKTLMHELGHVLYSYQVVNEINLDQDSAEEVWVEFIASNFLTLLGSGIALQEKVIQICNRKYNLSMTNRYFDDLFSEEQITKIKAGFFSMRKFGGIFKE